MQMMHEPENQQYRDGYRSGTEHPTYENEYGREKDAYEQQQSQFQGSSVHYQQKLQPLNKIHFHLATASVVISSILMGFAIPLFVLSIVNLVNNVNILVGEELEVVIIILVFASLVLLLAVAGFVISVIQLSLLSKKFPSSKRGLRH